MVGVDGERVIEDEVEACLYAFSSLPLSSLSPLAPARMAKSKLVARETSQGRIALAFEAGRGVMVEVSGWAERRVGARSAP